VTTEQDGTPEHGATSEPADDGDDGDEERGADGDADEGDDAQPAMADSAAITTSAAPRRTRPVVG
jgi:hypothetical protein